MVARHLYQLLTVPGAARSCDLRKGFIIPKAMLLKRFIFAIIGVLLSIPTTAVSQRVQPPTAKFKGIALDANRARIPNASVLIEGTDKTWKLETDEEGKTIGEINLELPAGKYKFTVEARGFKQLVVTDYRVKAGATIIYKFRLKIRDCDDCYLIAPRKR